MYIYPYLYIISFLAVEWSLTIWMLWERITDQSSENLYYSNLVGISYYSDCMDEFFVICNLFCMRNKLKCVCSQRSDTWIGAEETAEG